MSSHSSPSFFEHFSSLVDPRQAGKVKHQLFDILFLTISAVVAGCQGWEEIEDFGHDKLAWLRRFVPFSAGIPRHDTIARVVSRINLNEFQHRFAQWMARCEVLTEGAIVAIDGKTARGSYHHATRQDALHTVSAFACGNGLSLGQLQTNSKSNEISAIPELLQLLELKGCLVTLDAMGCQKAIASAIHDQQADYVLAIKGNQSGLHEQVKQLLLPAITQQSQQGQLWHHADYQHGREEFRAALTFQDLQQLPETQAWPGAKTVGVVMSARKLADQAQPTLQFRYYISSAQLSAEQLLHAVRSHWQIENQLHWRLDVAMREDDCRIRRDGGAAILAGIRHIALNLLTKEKSMKKGVRAKQMKAGRNDDYLEKVLIGK